MPIRPCRVHGDRRPGAGAARSLRVRSGRRDSAVAALDFKLTFTSEGIGTTHKETPKPKPKQNQANDASVTIANVPGAWTVSITGRGHELRQQKTPIGFLSFHRTGNRRRGRGGRNRPGAGHPALESSLLDDMALPGGIDLIAFAVPGIGSPTSSITPPPSVETSRSRPAPPTDAALGQPCARTCAASS